MRKLLRKITAVVSAAAVALAGVNFGGIGGLTAAAETVGAFTVTGGTLGTDYTYTGGVLTIKTDTPITISGETTTDTIVVEKNKNANITLDGVNINVSSAAFKIADDSTGTVTVTLKDGTVNTLTSGTDCAGLQKNGTNGKLIIQCESSGTEGHSCDANCGKLTANGSSSGAGIGGGI